MAGLSFALAAISGFGQNYIERGVELIELVQNLDRTYKSASPEKKRKMIEIVSSNRILRNGKVEFTYRKPFDILVESNGGNEKPPTVSGAGVSQRQIWLARCGEYRTFVLQEPDFNYKEIKDLVVA